MKTINLEDKVALITGGSGAIGRAIAKTLASAGSMIAVGYKDNERGALEVEEAYPGLAKAIKGDVSDPAECQRIVTTVVDLFGGLDILVNNAAIELRDTFDIPYGEWQSHWNDTLGANLMSAVNMTFCSIPRMKIPGGGKVINVSSRSAFRGETEYIAYAASKAALVNFTRCAARSLAKENVLVYAVAPGFIEAGMGMEGIRQRGDQIRSEIPSGKIGTPQDVADVVLFLASDLSGYITGSTIDVNGGSYLH
jgi:3-oxoacyl-[acyl-carrier protein] reductase